MKVLFTATQGEGHIRPLVPYARALALQGHEVAVAAPDDAAAILKKAGVVHHTFPGMSGEEFAAFWAPHWAKNLTRDATMQIAVPDMFIGLRARRALPVLMEIVKRWRPDLIIRESHEFAGLVAADAHNIPHVRINVSNCDVEARVIDFGADALDELRDEAGLAPDGGAGLWAEPIFTAFPFGFDGDARHGPDNPPFRVGTGTSGPPPATDWSPTGSRPLVYITFGTMVSARPGRDSVFRVALDAVAELDIEVLMTTGPGVDISSIGAIPDNAVVQAFVPQAAVFPFSTTMLCHGGSGTLLGGFAAGLPQVVAPQGADQPYNADRTESGGFGLHANASSPQEMHSALSRVLSRTNFAEAARRLGDELQAMPDHNVAAARIAALA
jgi:UDP:flavonoid glycosyltransferase YjiC (YdhE family)